MAQRDRSQGFGFVYVDIAKLLANKEWQKEGMPITSNEDAQVINFNRDPQLKAATETAPAEAPRDKVPAVQQIRENLDRLQSLHHKLHAMLAELNQLTGDKKKA